MFDKFTKGFGPVTYDKNTEKDDITEFLPLIPLSQEDIKGKSLYLPINCISQSKLRDSDFKIKRDKLTADYIVIPDFNHNKLFTVYNYTGYKRVYPKKYYNQVFPLFNEILDDLKQGAGFKYVTDTQVYKYIYKYEGDLALYKQLDELFASNSSDNAKMAMEFMSNANWNGNQVYLMQLISDYYTNKIRGSKYSYSISFKGFLNSLDFNYYYLNLDHPDKYRDLCENDEHHEFVFNKYKEDLIHDLNDLKLKYKIKFDSLEYSIDKELINKEPENESEE